MIDSPTPRIVIAPDSYKGSLDAEHVAQAIARGVLRAIPHARLSRCPMADGGEGTLQAMLHAGGTRHMVTVRDAGGTPRQAPVAMLADGSALIESAEIVGLTDTHAMATPVAARSTDGVGDAIAALLDRGVRRILLALGGSSTNDGGSGMLRALGARLLDGAGADVAPGPAGLAALARVDLTGLDPRFDPRRGQVTLIGMSDVTNPLCGSDGATAVFGPQKGVQPAEVATLDAALAHYSRLLATACGVDHAAVPGAGAAGGLGYALTMLGGSLQSGAELVCAQLQLDKHLDGADWLITGEGRSDGQTLQGKAPCVAARHARAHGVPASLLSGAVDPAALIALNHAFDGCFSIVPGPLPLSLAIEEAAVFAEAAAAQMAGLWFAAWTRPRRKF